VKVDLTKEASSLSLSLFLCFAFVSSKFEAAVEEEEEEERVKGGSSMGSDGLSGC